MARTDTLEHYLTDVADSIRAKTGESGLISADNFDIAISNIPSGGPSDIYRVATVQEMNALQNVEANSICVISTIAEGNWTATTSSSAITCPETVELPQEYSVSSSTYFEDTDNTFRLTAYFQHSRFRLEGYSHSDPLMIDVQYSSEDGIHYTRGNFEARNYQTQESLITGDTINLPVALSCNSPDNFEPLVGNFMLALQVTFDGIFTYDGSSWQHSYLGTNAEPGDLLVGKTAYTNDGSITGQFGSTFDKDYMSLYNDIINGVAEWQPTNYKKTNYSPQDASTYSVFSNYPGTELAVTKILDTSLVTDMKYMFVGCSNLTSLDLSNFNVSNVKHFDYMFRGCSSLTSIDLSSFNTGSVNELSITDLFYECTSLTSVNFGSHFNTLKCSSFNGIFNGCSGFTTLTLPTLNMTNVTNTSYMFKNCSSLQTLDLSNLISTNKITNVTEMFNGCKSLQTLDIRNLDLTKVTSSSLYKNMFGAGSSSNVPNNCLIIVKDNANKSWITSKFSRLTNVKTPSEL